jgi:hypothetical protein
MEEKRAILLKGLLATVVIWSGVVLLLVAIGTDLGAERSCSWGLSSRCRPTVCGYARSFLPGSLGAAPCWLLNLMPLMLIPGFVLWRIIQNEARLLLGGRRQAR